MAPRGVPAAVVELPVESVVPIVAVADGVIVDAAAASFTAFLAAAAISERTGLFLLCSRGETCAIGGGHIFPIPR